MLFAGYSDNLITMGKMMPIEEEMPSYDRFGWFYTVRLLIREIIFSFLLISSEKNHLNARDILNTPRKLITRFSFSCNITVNFLCALGVIAYCIIYSASSNIEKPWDTFVLLLFYNKAINYSSPL